jgi:hypothetical protein
MKPPCKQCGQEVQHKQGHINRYLKIGAPLYCCKACAGLARRLVNPPSEEERKAAKAAYDRAYRTRDPEKRKAERAAYYQRTRDPVKEAALRKERMPKHVEYCRRPEYKAWKSDYDRQLRDREYAEFAETYRLLLDLEKEIRSQATAYERRVANGYYTRNAQKRRRELWQLKQRN